MSRKSDRPGLRERFEAFKRAPDRLYHQLRLRHDVARLLERGLRARGMNQRALAAATGKQDSFISRLVHSEANCNLGTVAQVLVPLGISPKIVDEAEWMALRHRAESKSEVLDVGCAGRIAYAIVGAGGVQVDLDGPHGPAVNFRSTAGVGGRGDNFGASQSSAGPVAVFLSYTT